MAVIAIFSNSVKYKYKSKICSLSFLTVLVFVILSLLAPFFIITSTGGFWLNERVYTEKPDVSFSYKYLLIANKDQDVDPIVCSTFEAYKHNTIEDNCVLVKVREIDINSDGKKDILNFEAQFYTDRPIRSLKLLLFFNFNLRQLFKISMESIALYTNVLKEEVQNVQLYGTLTVHQNSLLNSDGLYETHNHTLEISHYSLEEVLMENFNRKFTATICNEYVTEQSGFSSEKAVIIKGQLTYGEMVIRYQPNIWEELKWAWVQYLSYFLFFAYITRHALTFLFTNRYLSSYIIVPWKNR